VQCKALGSEEVTLVYRRGQENMNASAYEQQFAQVRGVTLRLWAKPRQLLVDGGRVCGVEFESTQAPGETFILEADMVFKAIGQKILWTTLADTAQILDLKQDRIVVDDERRTSMPGVWAGGDCVAGGQDLTVSAVQDGKLAALSIDRFLNSTPGK
jgi:glutamate synthase (NADPH/NADH) small chain